MTTPLATIADALIEFILSLLHDPAAAAEFADEPEAVLARNGLSSVCVDDVRAVAPVVVDRPDVHPSPKPPPPGPPGPPSVEKEIMNISNNFTIDNRSSIVDQSVNQNIWTEGGDVNQLFDQEAVVNLGDHGAAAGDDADVDNSDTDVTVGDVAIGNEETTTTITDSFDDESTNTDVDIEAEAEDSFNDESTNVDVAVDDSFQYESDTDVTDTTSVMITDAPEDFEAEENL
ncbi:MAG: IniB N-terminal domain-containing protein [Microbacterium pygmaeum]|uniref:Uncharacterized protein n=1 Tax=Microbacterium pygmaeum TaxID=370764 RepID=A0A1G8DR86_9MICO|nr:IniB N-terminal domain-containing protein [Microbacterium pygmaeum]SDH60095.1 hypothetical protein SAMN04489810_3422 [Microbacterium pygmaeum]